MLKKKITSLVLVFLVFSLIITGCGMNASKSQAPSRTPIPAPSEMAASLAPSQDQSLLKYSTEALPDNGTAFEPDVEFNTEEYGEIVERGFISPLAEPLSTFSIDVDTASYSNIRRMIAEGRQVPKDAVRIEEMINYFKYIYPEPEGEAPFSVYTELFACPWQKDNKLLLIGLKGRDIDIKNIPPSNLVFLLDVSGSMEEYNKLPLVKKAFLKLVENLRPQDKVSIVTYAGSDSVIISGATGDEKLEISDAIENLEAGGSTGGAKGIETAYALAQKYLIREGNNRVILATDGDFNVGVSSEGELKRLIESKRDKGIYLSVLGFGTGNIKDNKMETLADHGNGNYAYIDSMLEAQRVLVEEMGGTLLTIAKDVKLQLEFNPLKVKGYRLIGYENRILNNEDFVDDTKDAGEMGAGHRVTALYEIVPDGSDQPVDQNNLKYQKSETTGSTEWLTINIRYKKPDQNESIPSSFIIDERKEAGVMSEDFAFASAVAEFGLLLRDSEYKGTAAFENVISLIADLPGVRQDVYKNEFLSMVRNMMD